MVAVEAVFGGEGNGGPIDPRVGYVRDSFVGMALVLAAMTRRGKKVSELAAELPRYEIVKRTTSLPPEKLPAAIDAVQKHFADARPDRLDGLRLDWSDRWLIVRGSNTEPIVRVIAEAPTAAAAQELTAAACDAIGRA
jgi:phosphomannomutase